MIDTHVSWEHHLLDRYWAPHNGRLPGSALDLPFLAPADHFLELEGCAVLDTSAVVQLCSWIKIAAACGLLLLLVLHETFVALVCGALLEGSCVTAAIVTQCALARRSGAHSTGP